MANTQYAVPQKLFAVIRPETIITQAHTGRMFYVKPAFIVDALYPSLVKSAKDWATPDSDFKELDNDPISWVTVINITHRSEGGIVFKVMTPQRWLVDLRETEFMEAALSGQLVGGVITDNFVWTRGINQMRLVRIDGKTYSERKIFGTGIKESKTEYTAIEEAKKRVASRFYVPEGRTVVLA